MDFQDRSNCCNIRTYAEPLLVGWAVPTLLLRIVFKREICVSPKDVALLDFGNLQKKGDQMRSPVLRLKF